MFLKNKHNDICNKLHTSKLQWPIQGKPGKKGFALWVKCFQKCFNVHLSGRLYYQFGNWCDDITNNTNDWKTYYHPPTSFIFIKTKDSYQQYTATKVRSSSASYNTDIGTMFFPILPNNCIPAESSSSRGLSTVHFCITKPESSTNKNTIHPECPKWKEVMLKHMMVIDEAFLNKLLYESDDNIIITTDGWVHDYNGTFGQVISNCTNPIVTNKGQIYSVNCLQSAYRCELYGILSGIITFTDLVQQQDQQISNKHIIIMTDNKSIIRLLKKRRYNTSTGNDHKGPDVDLELQIIFEIKELEMSEYKIDIRYVKGHQDRLTRNMTTLNHFAQMNILADNLSKEARSLSLQKHYHSFPQNPVDFNINSEYINSKYAKIISNIYHSMELRSYLQSRHNCGAATLKIRNGGIYFINHRRLCVKMI